MYTRIPSPSCSMSITRAIFVNVRPVAFRGRIGHGVDDGQISRVLYPNLRSPVSVPCHSSSDQVLAAWDVYKANAGGCTFQ